MNKINGVISSDAKINMSIVTGAKGLSAYEVWLSVGNVGTENDFLDSLVGGGSGGSTNYNLLRNKPTIENVELIENKSFEDLGLVQISEGEISNLF